MPITILKEEEQINRLSSIIDIKDNETELLQYKNSYETTNKNCKIFLENSFINDNLKKIVFNYQETFIKIALNMCNEYIDNIHNKKNKVLEKYQITESDSQSLKLLKQLYIECYNYCVKSYEQSLINLKKGYFGYGDPPRYKPFINIIEYKNLYNKLVSLIKSINNKSFNTSKNNHFSYISEYDEYYEYSTCTEGLKNCAQSLKKCNNLHKSYKPPCYQLMLKLYNSIINDYDNGNESINDEFNDIFNDFLELINKTEFNN